MTESPAMMNTVGESHFHVIERVAQAVTGIGAGMAAGSGVLGQVTENHEIIWQCGIIIGSAVGVTGLIVNWYYKHQENKRLDRIHRMKEIEHTIRVKNLNKG